MSKLSRKNPIKEIAEELDVLDDMLSALVEILEEKGVLTQEEWEEKIRTKVQEGKSKTKFRELPP